MINKTVLRDTSRMTWYQLEIMQMPW